MSRRRSGYFMGNRAAVAAIAATAAHRAILNIITADAQGLLGLAANTLVAVRQRTGQRSRDLFVAAAGVALRLTGNLDRRLLADAFIAVVQTIDKGAHDFGIALAIELVAQFVQSTTTFLGIAGGLRNINPVSNLTRIRHAAFHFLRAAGLSAAALSDWAA